MEAQKKKDEAEEAARLRAKEDEDKARQMKDYYTTNTLSRKFAKMRDGLRMLAP